MELNEDEKENWRKFEVLKDLNIFGILAISLVYSWIFIEDIVRYYGTVAFPTVITGDVALFVWGLLFGYICVDYLRPHIHGGRSFAFTWGVFCSWWGVLIYFIYVKLIEYQIKRGT